MTRPEKAVRPTTKAGRALSSALGKLIETPKGRSEAFAILSRSRGSGLVGEGIRAEVERQVESAVHDAKLRLLKLNPPAMGENGAHIPDDNMRTPGVGARREPEPTRAVDPVRFKNSAGVEVAGLSGAPPTSRLKSAVEAQHSAIFNLDMCLDQLTERLARLTSQFRGTEPASPQPGGTEPPPAPGSIHSIEWAAQETKRQVARLETLLDVAREII